MTPLHPKITSAALALFPTEAGTGFQLELTHVAISTAMFDPTGEETTLPGEVARFPLIAGGAATAPNQIHLGWNITDTDPDGNSANDQWIGAIGIYAGPVLFAVWSRSSKPLFFKTAEFDVPFAYLLDVSRLPAGSVTVALEMGDAAMQSMLFQHEGHADPHPQYLTKQEGDSQYFKLRRAKRLFYSANM